MKVEGEGREGKNDGSRGLETRLLMKLVIIMTHAIAFPLLEKALKMTNPFFHFETFENVFSKNVFKTHILFYLKMKTESGKTKRHLQTLSI